MKKIFLITGAILGLIAIILGAFGAHGLKKIISPEQLISFETGVRYQMYHALLLLLLGSMKIFTKKTLQWIYFLVLIGIILFSGSIYGLATNDYTPINFKSVALITPLGGSLLMIAWGILIIKFFKIKVD